MYKKSTISQFLNSVKSIGLKAIGVAVSLQLLITAFAHAQPSTQASNIFIFPQSITWTNGNGTNRLVVISENGGAFVPQDGVDYAAAVDADYDDAPDQDASAGVAKIVYGGTGSSVTVDGLNPSTFYTIRVYEFISTGFLYNTLYAVDNPIVGWYYANPAATTDYTAPAGIRGVIVQAWGGGGGSGGNTAAGNSSENGGGGGAYASSLVTVVPGDDYEVTVGNGGAGTFADDGDGGNGGTSSFASSVVAVGGFGASANATGGAGGDEDDCVGTFKNSGGDGGARVTGAGTPGGGGGGSAGRLGDGGDGQDGDEGRAGGAAGAGGGAAGGNGGSNGNPGLDGNFPGGGGGGQGGSASNTGDGAGGLVIVSYSRPSAAITYSDDIVNASQNILITVTFTEALKPTPAPQIAISGANTLAATNMTPTANPAVWTYTHDVDAGNGIAEIALSIGQSNVSGNVIHSTPSSGQTFVVDNTPPSATNTPTAAAGPVINGTEETAGFIVNVALGSSGAAEGDVLELLLDGSPFPAPITKTLTSTDIGNGNTDLTVSTTQLGSDGPKSITARVVDPADNAGPESAPLALTLDTTPPGITNAPTAVAGPIINDTEESGGFIVNVILGSSGAVAGDVLHLLLGGSAFPSPLLKTLTGTDITNGNVDFNIPSGQMGSDGAKSITARLADDAANEGAASTALNLTLDTNAPAAPDAPSASAGPIINAAEELAGFVVNVDLGTSGAMENDVLHLFLDGADFPSPISKTLTSTDISNGDVDFTISTTQLGADGSKAITAFLVDEGGNTGAMGPALNLSLDTSAPAATHAPASLDGPIINGTEESAGFTVNVDLGLSGAIANDVLHLLLDGNPFPTPITKTLTGTDISNGNVDLTVVSGQLGIDGSKLISARIVDAGGNQGPESSTLALTLDTNGPTATSTPTAVAGPYINASESSAGFTIVVPLGTSDAAAGDVLELLLGGAPFPTPLVKTLDALDLAAMTVSFNIASGQLGADGAKSITAVIEDVNENLGTPSTSLNLTLDTNAPAVVTAGAVTTTGGRVVNTYWNMTNTGVQIVVPVSNTDASLDNGSVQVQVNNTLPSGFQNIPGTGVSTITNGERLTGTKTISISAANLEGATPAFGEGNTLVFRVVITDIAGNSTTGNQSVATLVVDQTPPAIISNLIVSPGAGSGGRDVIQFRVSEPLTNHAASPVERAHNFAFISTDNAYGSPGISVDDAITNDVKYLDNGLVNTIESSLTNSELVFIESKDNSAGWSVADLTNVRYVQGGPASNANFVMRDAAGNELNNFIQTVSPGTTTTLAGALSGVAPGPAILNSATNQVLFAFSLTANSTLNLTSLRINSSTDVDGLLSNFRLFSSAGLDDFSLASDLSLSPSVSTTSIEFNTISVPLTSGVTRYFYLLADVEDYFPVASPTIQFSMTDSDFTVSTGGITGTTQTSVNYTLTDVTQPTITSVSLPSANPNYSGSVDFEITFSEPVTILNNSAFSLTGTASTTGEIISNTGSGTTHTVTVSNIGNEGTRGLRIVSTTGSIRDVANNGVFIPGPLVLGYTTATYQVYAPEPSNDVTTLDVTTTTPTSITLTWTDVATYPVPHGYLVTAAIDPNTAAPPSDGTPISDLPFNGTIAYDDVPAGTQTTVFTGLLSGFNYTFKIYPYTNSGANINYKDDNVNTGTEAGSTPTASVGRIASSGSVSIIQNFPSTTTNDFLPVNGAFSGLQANFWMQFSEDGFNTAADNAKTLITEMVFKAGPNSTVTNWDEVIAEAKLRAFTSSGISLSEKDSITTADITADRITFSGIPTGNGRIGEIDDDEVKYYQLYIRLKDPLDNIPLRELIDGRRFEFVLDLDPITGMQYGAGSSKFDPTQVIDSDNSNNLVNNRVDVDATEFRFVQSPTSALLGVAMSPLVSIEATDSHGNRDLDYNASVTITSTGTIPATSATLSLGIGTASVIHTAKGDDLTLSATDGSISSSSSSTFDITGSSQADIVLNTAFVEPTDIDYKSFQAANITSLGGAINIAQFILRDGGAAVTDADAAPTVLDEIDFSITNWQALRSIALYRGLTELGEVAPGPTVTFDNVNLIAPDNGTAPFFVRVSFKNTAPDITDNQRIEVQITRATTTNTSSDFAAPDAGGATSSQIPTDNVIEVIASKLVFTTPPDASVFANVPFASAPIVLEARDINDILDVDYGEEATITNAGTIPMTDANNTGETSIPISFLAGILTFENDFRYDHRGSGDGTLTINAPASGPSPAILITSDPINIISSDESDIVEAAYNYEDNIDYLDYQATTIDLSTPGDEIKLAEFTLRDGGGTDDDDATGTELTSITFAISNHDFIKSLALYEGTSKIKEVTLSGPNVTFDLISITAADFSTTTLNLYATFKDQVIDNEQISIAVVGAVANPKSSTFGTPDAGGAFTDLGADDNKIEVNATQLVFTIPSTATTVDINEDFAIEIQAQDIKGNLDADFDGDITAFSNTGTLTMVGQPDPADPLDVFAGGLFNSVFQYTSDGGGANGAGTLTIAAGGLPPSTSPDITVTSSAESIFRSDPAFTAVTDIAYIDYQNISTVATSFELARFELIDGNGTTPDDDGAGTNINDITFSVTNPANVRSLAIYLGNTLIQSKDNDDFVTVGPLTTVTFESLSGDIKTDDDGELIVTVRASFFDDGVAITDRAEIQLQVTDISRNGGSQFDESDPGNIGGVFGGAYSDPNTRIEVIATRLDFTTQPGTYAGINQPITAPIVEAVDANGVRDLDFTYMATVSSAAAGISITSVPFGNNPTFGPGVLDLAALQYTSAGLGTLSISSTGSNGVITSTSAGAISCQPVYVVHITASSANGLGSGVLNDGATLTGGGVNKTLFGVTFHNATSGSIPAEPKLTEFTITFDNPIDNVFENNLRIYESLSDAILQVSSDLLADVTTSIVGTNSIRVQFNTPQFVPASVTYFLRVDIQEAIDYTTPSIRPSLVALGFDNGLQMFDPTAGNIGTTNGSAFSNIQGNQFEFSDITPPVLTSSNPYNGKPNHDINGNISLTFSEPVRSLDGYISLYDQTNGNAFVADLPLHPSIDPETNVGTLIFSLNGLTLTANNRYYITINPGNRLSGQGIVDASDNGYAGITSSSVLSFNTANYIPPVLKSVEIINVTTLTADLKVELDQIGRVYYLVVPSGSAAPTLTSEIRDGTYASAPVIAFGSFDIERADAAQYGSITANFGTSTAYDVWIFAENNAEPLPVESGIYTNTPPVPPNTVATPTFSFTTPGTAPAFAVFAPTTSICPGDFQPIFQPVSLIEGNPADFTTGTFNLVLPNGFVFNTMPGTGSVVIENGTGSGGSASLEYLNNTIVRITYNSTTTSAIDRMIIKGLEVKSLDANATGSLVRLGGTGLTALVPDETIFCSLNSFAIDPIDFINGIPGNPVFISNTNKKVKLIPQPVLGDYGPNVFSGFGVSADTLYTDVIGIGAVDITLTHTDLNGCTATTTKTYNVYDDNNAIIGLRNQYCVYDGDVVIPYDALLGYKLTGLTAEVPLSYDQPLTTAIFQSIASTNPDFLVATGEGVINANVTYTYTFSPTAFNTPDLQAYFKPFFQNNDGGPIGRIRFTAEYTSESNFATVSLPIDVTLYYPPIASLTIQQAGPAIGNIYCENNGDLDLRLTALPAPSTGISTGVFSINSSTAFPGLVDQNNGNATLNTQAASNNYDPLSISYTYTSLVSGCFSTTNTPVIDVDGVPTTFSEIRITPNPTAHFISSTPACIGVPVSFDATGSNFGSITGFVVDSLTWDFADATFSTFDNPNEIQGRSSHSGGTADMVSHTFTQSARYPVELVAYSNFGCASNTVIDDIDVGAIPEVNFSFKGIATNEAMSFTNETTLSSSPVIGDDLAEAQLEWNFGDGTILPADPDEDIEHTYLSPGKNTVTLSVTSEIGCANHLSKLVVVVPKVTFDETNQSHLESFEGGDAGYQFLAAQGSASSWEHGVPDGTVINDPSSENHVWTTGLGSAFNPQERSFLYTSCFNLNGLTRPIITFNSFVNVGTGDGVVLEYSTDNRNIADPNKQWETIGRIENSLSSGVGWYNGVSLPTKPGQKETGFGWTGRGTDWAESKHSLSNLIGEDTVVFRFSFASGSSDPATEGLDGFAIDDLRIGNGTRTVLLENFTNTGVSQDPLRTLVSEQNKAFRNFEETSVGVQVIKIDYHVGFPGEDPFNQANSMDPGARALYYNISQIPQSRMDGEPVPVVDPDAPEDWAVQQFNERVLFLAEADIHLDQPTFTPEGELSVTVSFTPGSDFDQPTLLHLAILEEEVTTADNPGLESGRIQTGETEFKYVLRKMLPNAAGTKYNTLAAGQTTESLTFTWSNANLFNPEDDIVVVAFLQDEKTRRIYQAEIVRGVEDPSVVTGIEDLNTSFNVYPNPADKELTVTLPHIPTQSTIIQMFDQMGKVVNEGNFEAGQSTKTISTEDFAGGVYVIQVRSEKGIMRRKVMVVHRN